MIKNKQKLLITAAVLAVAGGVIFAAAFAALGFDISKISTQKYESNTYVISENFDSIKINTETANVVFAESDSDKCRVECAEREKMKHSVSVSGKTLVIETVNTRKWYDYIGMYFGNETVTVYLPKAAYASLAVDTDTGRVEIPKKLSFESVSVKTDTGAIGCYADVSNSIELKTDTGSIRVEKSAPKGEVKVQSSTGIIFFTDVRCGELYASSNTGNIDLKNTTAADNLTINCDTGNVRFEDCDSSEIKVQTDTGNIIGTLLSNKIFFAESAVGKVDVPKTMSGGACELVTDTGNIKIQIKK